MNVFLVDKRVLSQTRDRSSQIAGRSDWDFDAWMAKGDGCAGVEESMAAFQGLVGSPAS
jgi:hypothetical protein